MLKSLVAFPVVFFALSTAQATTPEDTKQHYCNNYLLGLSVSYIEGTNELVVERDNQNVVAGPWVFSSSSNVVTPLGEIVTLLTDDLRIADEPATVYTLVVPGSILTSDTDIVYYNSRLLIGANGGFRATPTVFQNIGAVVDLKCSVSLLPSKR